MLQQFASATVAAALIAAVVAIIVAVVNARAARALALDAAHREYRKVSVKPILRYSRGVAQHIGALHRVLAPVNTTSGLYSLMAWNDFVRHIPAWQVRFIEIGSLAGPLYASDSDVQQSLELLIEVARTTTDTLARLKEISAAESPHFDPMHFDPLKVSREQERREEAVLEDVRKQQEIAVAFCQATHRACATVELSIEAYVYEVRGGVGDARDRMRQTRDDLKNAEALRQASSAES